MFSDHVSQDRFGYAGGPDPTGLQNEETIGEPFRFIHVVGRQNDPQTFGAQAVDQLPHGDPGVWIQAGGGFIEKDQPWLMNHGARDHEAALEATGKRLRLVVGVWLKAESLDQLIDPPGQVRVGRAIVAPGLDKVAPHRELAVVGIVLGANPERATGLVPFGKEVVPGDADRPGIGPEKPVAHAQGRRLAGTVWPQEAHDLAGPAGQIDAIHNAFATQVFDQAGGFKQDIRGRTHEVREPFPSRKARPSATAECGPVTLSGKSRSGGTR